jgi:tetratricopeptide (TPR) repeat protein
MENAHPSPRSGADKISDDAVVIEPAFGLGRWAPFNWERLPHSTGIRLFWGRIALWVAALAVAAWVAGATGLFFFIKYQRGFADVRYEHVVLLPWKLADYRRSKGEFLIKEGLAKAEQQEWRAAFAFLRPGLLAVPEHQEGRLMVARLYLMAGRPDVTRTTLLDGLEVHGGDIAYLRQVLGYFFELQADETVIAVSEQLRERLEAGTPAARMARTALAYAHFNRSRYEEAEAALMAGNLLGTPEGRYVQARIAWERGRRDESITRLRELAVQAPQEDEAYATLSDYLEQEGRWDEMRRAAWLRQLARPERPEAYVDYIKACIRAGDDAARTEATEGFFARFANDTQALFKLAEFAASEGRVEETVRVAGRCRELGRDEAIASLLELSARLKRRAYDDVVERCIDLGREATRWTERHRLVMGGLRAAALYGLRQEMEAETLARRLTDSTLLPPPVLTSLAGELTAAGQSAAARRVLAHAVMLNTLYQPALVELLRLQLQDGQLQDSPALIDRLLGMRKPPQDLLADLAEGLGSDRYLFLSGRLDVQARIAEFLRWRAERVRG